MQTDALLHSLGYDSSPNCLRDNDLRHAPDFGHVFRRAQATSSLEAVYCLCPPKGNRVRTSITPVSYVCKVASLEDADAIHKRVWNQNVVPFLIVLAPQGIRVYTGFERRQKSDRSPESRWLAESDFDRVTSKLSAWSADSIDSGAVWDRWGAWVRPKQRVEWRLLEDLQELERQLRAQGLKDAYVLHALIGRFVFLHYLRERGFLSDERLGLWNLSWNEAAGRDAKLSSFITLCDELEERLNGSIFPLTKNQLKRTVGASLVQFVASIFAGDSPDGQRHLDFKAYDFSHIPVETLSIIYEQFLHLRPVNGGSTAGREQAAYYTPLPVVNFMIDRMHEVRPLEEGMRVLDPACGSGAFLVQCYRKLIEDRWRADSANGKPRPTELRSLLTGHIFGIDVDGEACRVAELSLLLTLLDYCEPPDLLTTNGKDRSFKLPDLSEKNIIEANAFDDTDPLIAASKRSRFDWIIGNPPWKGIKGTTTNVSDQSILRWIQRNKKFKPTGGNEAAEAFAWRTQDFATQDGLAGLLMPAMSLFKSESKEFRQQFFLRTSPAYIANFSNLAEVLFAGRSRVPAAVVIFHPKRRTETDTNQTRIPVFAPLVANQEPTRPRGTRRRIDTWNIVIDEAEMRAVELADICRGDSLTWKIAAWGSHLDRRLLHCLSELRSLGEWADEIGLTISEGLQLRGAQSKGGEPVEHHPELEGRRMLVTDALRGADRLFSFPPTAMGKVTSDQTYVRKGRFNLPESVCRPPHVIVGSAGKWAVFTNKYVIVPARQVGIAGKREHASLLMALGLYFNSDFFQYHQFFCSPQFGVKREVSTLRTFRSMPIPKDLVNLDEALINTWSERYRLLCQVESDVRRSRKDIDEYRTVVHSTNQLVSDALGLSAAEADRIDDFVRVMLGLRDGKVESRAVSEPSPREIREYSAGLKRQLDSFVGEVHAKHGVEVWRDGDQGVIQIDVQAQDGRVRVHPKSEGTSVLRRVAALRERLESEFSQWRYFNRNLTMFAEDRVYLFKPMQRFHWLKSQAVLDASEVIALVINHAGVNGDQR